LYVLDFHFHHKQLIIETYKLLASCNILYAAENVM